MGTDNPTATTPEAPPRQRVETPTFNVESIFDRPMNTLADRQDKLPEGWEKAGGPAGDTLRGLNGDFQKLDSAEEQVRQAQASGVFTDKTNPTDGTVTRTYPNGIEHQFARNGEVTMNLSPEAQAKLPEGQRYRSIKFDPGGNSATVTDAAGNQTTLSGDQLRQFEGELQKVFDVKGTTQDGSNWRMDVRGNTHIDNVKDMPAGSHLTVYPPNSPNDVRYRADVPANDGRPAYSTEATGEKVSGNGKKAGLRFVDFQDGQEPASANGRTVEGFAAPRDQLDKAVAYVSDNGANAPVKSETKIQADGSAVTTYTDDPQGRVREIRYPENHPSGRVSATEFDPAKDAQGRRVAIEYGPNHPDHMRSEVSYDPNSPNNPTGLISRAVRNDGRGEQVETARVTKDATDPAKRGQVEFSSVTRYPGNETSARAIFENQEQFRAGKPLSSTTTSSDGTVVTNFAQGARPDGVRRAQYRPGDAAPTLFKADPSDPTKVIPMDANVAADKTAMENFGRPVLSEQTTGDTTRKVYADGSVETSDKKTGITSTDYADRTVTQYTNPPSTVTRNKADGSVTTDFPPPGRDGVLKAVYRPGQAPELTGADGNKISDAALITRFGQNPPEVHKETSEGRTRSVRADGSVETTFNPPLAGNRDPRLAAEARLAGINLDNNPRLDLTGVTKITEGVGARQNAVRVDRDPAKAAETRQPVSEVLNRNARGEVVSSDRQGEENGKKYTERLDYATNRISRQFENGDLRVTDNGNPPKPIFERTTTTDAQGNKIVTTKEGGREEIRGAGKLTIKENGETREYVALPREQGDKVTRYVDPRTGYVAAMDITEGRNAGQSYTFDRNPDGTVKGIGITIPGRDGAPDQRVNLTKTEQGWQTNPPGAQVPGFDMLVRDNSGNIKGDFKVNNKGDITYEYQNKERGQEKWVKQISRSNGERESYDLLNYARVRENAEGQRQPTEFWDGYNWRQGNINVQESQRTGKMVVDFQGADGPKRTIRDGVANSFEVQFQNGTSFKTDNWNSGKMSRTAGGKTDTLYNTGVVGGDGRVQWAKGREEQGRVIYDDPKVATGELPQSSVFNPETGEVTSTFKNGSTVTSDGRGRQRRIQSPGQTPTEVLYGANGELRGYRQGNREILKGPDVNQGPGTEGMSEWTIKMNGQERKFVGKKVDKPGGFEIVGPEGKYESNGRFTTKEDGKQTVYDARGQRWQQDAAGPPEVWRMGDKPPLTGTLTRFENGNVGVTGTDKITTMYNPDNSTSKLDERGVERERTFADGSYIKRGEDGKPIETRTRVGTGEPPVFETSKFKYGPVTVNGRTEQGIEQVTTRNAAGQVIRVERPVNGQMRQVAPESINAGATTDEAAVKTEPAPKFVEGTVVRYDAMGTRSVITGNADRAEATVTDIHGVQRKLTYEKNRLTSATGGGTAGGGDMTFQYANDTDANPATIKRGTETFARVGGPDSNIYNVGGTQMRLDQRTGELKPDSVALDPSLARQTVEAPTDQARAATPADTSNILGQALGLRPEQVEKLRGFLNEIGVKPDALARMGEIFNKYGLNNPEFLAKANTFLKQYLATQTGGMEINAQNFDQMFQMLNTPQVKEQLKAKIPQNLDAMVNAADAGMQQMQQALQAGKTPQEIGQLFMQMLQQSGLQQALGPQGTQVLAGLMNEALPYMRSAPQPGPGPNAPDPRRGPR